MTDVIERVARAICVADKHDPDYPVLRHTGKRIECWRLYVDEAQAAIASTRDPTPAMIEAGWRKVTYDLADGNDRALSDLFTAMIDEALK